MSEELELRYHQAHITPFWKKLPFFFLYPFRFGPLVLMLCLVGCSALAGMALGAFGLVFRGLLVYFGLRYAFNVLDLFARGRFEGDSPDKSLWGAEKRPAKLGLMLALFLVVAVTLGNMALERRVERDAAVQDRLVALWKQAHAEELNDHERDRQEWEQRQAARAAARLAPAKPPEAYSGADAGPGEEGPAAAVVEPEAEDPAPQLSVSREEMVQQFRPQFGEPLWLQLQPAWFWVVIGLLSLMLPAAAIVIAVEDSFFRALNPLRMFHLMGAMGAAYFVLWAFFLAIAGARQAAFTLGTQWPAMFRLPAEMAVVTYLGLVLFAIMGYALYQFHQELHLEVDVDFEEHRAAGGAEAIAAAGSANAAARAATPPQDPWESKLQALEAAGNFREAIAEVKDRMRYAAHDVPLNARLHGLYHQLGDRDVILTHGQQYLSALARAGHGRVAADVLKKLQAMDPAVQVQDGDVVLPAAKAALQQGDVALATGLLRSFDKRFPKHKDTAAVFFLGARLLSEQNRQHAQAAKILRAVLQHFPEHEVAGEAKTYLQVLEKTLVREGTAA